jgi:membrane-associated phospholipid phosphatase
MKLIFFFLLSFCFIQTINAQNWDINLLKDINKTYSKTGGSIMVAVTETGGPLSYAMPVGFFVAGKLHKDHKMVVNSYEMASAALINGIVTTVLKTSIQRERPFETYPDEVTKYSSGGSYSMPSGHTSTVFAAATSVSILYPKWYVIAPSYLFAASVGYSRMYLGVHYPSDVLIGAVIGTASSYGAHLLFKQLKKKYFKDPVKL